MTHSVLCTDPNHSQERDSLTLDILVAMVEASHSSLPVTGGGGAGKHGGGWHAIPGWVEEVEPFRQESKYWHYAWLAEGRPSTGWLYSTMVRKRTQFHYAVRRLKRKAALIKAKRLFQASIEGDIKLLKEMKALRSGGFAAEPDLPDTVAGANGQEEIVEKFKEVYSALYNSASSEAEMPELVTKVAELIRPESSDEVSKVTGYEVKKAVSQLKSKKGDVSGSFTSDALIHAPDELFDILASIFRSWLLHGTVTRSLLACAFLPLLKSSLKDPCDTGSYRAIAGSSLILKLFENVMLLIWGHLLSTDSLQFGFKANTSTTQCTWLVQEVIGHYLRNGSHPIVTVLDCSKAFDTCKFSILFEKLIKSGIPPVVIRTLMTMYQQQYAWTRWGQAVSSRFPISNGTRQGSMASPALWSVYLDLLIKELRQLGVGCHVAGMYMGVVVYADDVLLMAPFRSPKQLMLNQCQDYASGHNHGHLGSNQMLKNGDILNQKNGNVKENKASHYKYENL